MRKALLLEKIYGDMSLKFPSLLFGGKIPVYEDVLGYIFSASFDITSNSMVHRTCDINIGGICAH